MIKTTQKIGILAFLLLALLNNSSFAGLDVPLKGIDGKQHKISEYIGHGKWVVLNIWGTRCPPCREEMPELVRFHDEHHNSDAIVVGIAIDFPSYGYANKTEVTSFSDDYLIDFTLLLGDSSITEKLGLGRLEALPTTYLFNPRGEVVGAQVGGITKKILEDFINKNKTSSTNESTNHK